MQKYIFRIVYPSDWAVALETGSVPQSTLDREDGFVHLSTKDTVLETANLYFDAEKTPLVLKLDAHSFGDSLRWEWVESRGASFPHLYGTIDVQSVVAIVALLYQEGSFFWGEEKKKSAWASG